MRTLSLLSLLAAGCVSHIAPYTAKHREFEKSNYADATEAHGNSLFAASARSLTEDERARRIGDIVIISLDETTNATHDDSTTLGRKQKSSLALTGGLIDALQKVVPSVQLAQLLGVDGDSQFNGVGTINRSGKMSGTLSVRVLRVLPNGDLLLEGSKVVMVGEEEHHLYISGVIRQADLRLDGSVLSSRVADAEIEYTGRGDIADQQRQGWLTRILNKVSPF
jgi:flagellar L-ring protein precursor FlgH